MRLHLEAARLAGAQIKDQSAHFPGQKLVLLLRAVVDGAALQQGAGGPARGAIGQLRRRQGGQGDARGCFHKDAGVRGGVPVAVA